MSVSELPTPAQWRWLSPGECETPVWSGNLDTMVAMVGRASSPRPRNSSCSGSRNPRWDASDSALRSWRSPACCWGCEA